MEANRIIITDVICPLGRYTKFTRKVGGGGILAEVDRSTKSRHGYSGYILFCNRQEIARHSSKKLLIEMAKEYIRGFIPNAEFKLNVCSENYKKW